MKQLLIAGFISFFFSSALYGQNMLAEYKVSKNIELIKNNGQKVNVTTLEMKGLLYKKGNKFFSYSIPLYISKYPDGSISYTDVNGSTDIIVINDSTQQMFFKDLDSMKFKGLSDGSIQFNTKPTLFKGNYNPRFVSWHILPDSSTIAGLKCQKAELYRSSGNHEKLYEIWFCADVPVAAGPGAMVFVPGLVVEATSYVTKETYTLIRYTMNAAMPESFTKIPFFAAELAK